MNWEIIRHEQKGGFLVEFSISPEQDDPRGHFATGDDEADAETVRRIESGFYLWFVARVTVAKAGVVLGTDYLGGCCYKSAEDFLAPGGYYPDMVNEAMNEARVTLSKLCCEAPKGWDVAQTSVEG